MKALTLLACIAIIIHQYHVEYINSILIVEIIGLILFYILGNRAWKEFNRGRERQRHLRGGRGYVSPKENKTWRTYQSNTEVKKPTFMDDL